MSCKILSLDDIDAWRSHLNHLPVELQDIYFTPEYYRLYEKLGDGKAQCFTFRQGNQLALYPFLINSVNNLGFELDQQYFDIHGAYGYNGVVSSSCDPDFISAFYRAFDHWCNENKVIAEFTRFHPLLNNQHFSEKYLHTFFDRKTVVIDLRKGYGEVAKHFQRTTKKQLRRAVDRYHLIIDRYENNPDCLDIFYPIYTETMNRVKAEKYLYFSLDYFQNLIQSIPSVCLLASNDKKPVAAIIAFYNQTYVHGHLGGTITEALGLSPFSLLYDQMIRFGVEKSCSYLHVGGGRTSAENDALLGFKLNFSSHLADFYIGKKIHNKEVYAAVVDGWEEKNPDKVNKYRHHLLKYRY